MLTLSEIGKLAGKKYNISKKSIPEEIPYIKKGKVYYYSEEYIDQIIDWINKPYKEKLKSKFGVENMFQLQKVKDKSRETCKSKYGKEWYAQTDNAKEIAKLNLIKAKETIKSKYGVDSYSKTKEFKDKRNKTLLERYGTTSINPKYYYDNQYFDSSWELALYYLLKSKGVKFTYHPDGIEYDSCGSKHIYYPDFKINNNLVEIKGDHLFNEDSLIDLYHNDSYHNQKAKDKYLCMVSNNVLVLKYAEICPALDYCKQNNFNLEAYKIVL